jgi:hypothetical protein
VLPPSPGRWWPRSGSKEHHAPPLLDCSPGVCSIPYL